MKDMETLIPELRTSVLRMAAEDAAIVIDEAARRRYPPQPRARSQSQFWTEKQQRWWWATMHAKAQGKSRALPGWRARYVHRDGVKRLEISGAYRRTGVGVQSLSYRIKAMPDSATIHYGTNRAYMRYVIDRDRQAKYHAGNWTPLQDIVESAMEKATETFMETLTTEIRRRIT